jgi:hypothetical protein
VLQFYTPFSKKLRTFPGNLGETPSIFSSNYTIISGNGNIETSPSTGGKGFFRLFYGRVGEYRPIPLYEGRNFTDLFLKFLMGEVKWKLKNTFAEVIIPFGV